jgi:Ras-related protein Rab-8A
LVPVFLLSSRDKLGLLLVCRKEAGVKKQVSKQMGDVQEIKLLTIGDSGVGKSSLLLRWANADTSQVKSSMPTVGIDFKFKNITVDGNRVKVQVWDTAGQERFRTLTSTYYRKAQGVLLVYDVTSRDSFNNVRNWMHQVTINADVNISVYLVGNKLDVVEKRQVSFEEGEALAKEFKTDFKEVSAWSGQNVNESFLALSVKVIERLAKGDSEENGRGRTGSFLRSHAPNPQGN